MADENLLATLEGSLRQTRGTRARLAARLLEIELEAEKLRAEVNEMDQLSSQTEAAMFRIMSSMLSRESASANAAAMKSSTHQDSYQNFSARYSPSDAQIEAALREDQARNEAAMQYKDSLQYKDSASYKDSSPPPSPRFGTGASNASTHSPIVPPPIRPEIETDSDRFLDRTIPQATALLLRESGAPLHVNELYNRLREGGFQFTGQNPTISIAVSLNRNRRFRKVAPGTFDLMIRDAAQAS